MAIKFFDDAEFYSKNRLSDEERKAAAEYTEADISDAEVKFAYTSGCIIFRYFTEETGYYFSAPYALTDEADTKNAFLEISEYAKMQEIPEVIVDILKEELPLALRGAQHYEKDEDEDGVCMVRIYTECMLTEELPEALCGEIYLGEFAAAYAANYEKLVKNDKLNLHFGYNLCDDVPNGRGEDFINFVRSEFERGVSMTFAATVLREGLNVFVGEGCLYGFDGRSGAQISFRVLPEFQRRGYGESIFCGLLKIAKDIGLVRIFASVKRENVPSLELLRKYAEPISQDGAVFKFVFNVEK